MTAQTIPLTKFIRVFSGSIILISLFLFFLASDIYASVSTYQYTSDSSNISDMSINNEYLAWFLEVGSDHHLYMADILRGRFIPVDTSDVPKKNVDVSGDGRVVWAQGSGNTTDIYYFGSSNDIGAMITTDGNNHRKVNIDNSLVTWVGSDGTNDQIWVVDIPTREMTQVTNNTAAKDDPLVTYNSTLDSYIVFWEEDGVLKYWENESATPTVNTAHTPGAGCSNQLTDVLGRGFAVFIEDCASTDVIRVFDVGADPTVTTDDASAQISAGSQTTSSNGRLGSTGTGAAPYAAWVEGSGTSAEIWACKTIANCGGVGNRVQVTSNSLLDDTPDMLGNLIVWHRESDSGNDDIIFYNIISGGSTSITNDSDEDSTPIISALDGLNIPKLAWIRTPSGTSDEEIFIGSEDITTNTGVGVSINLGDGSKITFDNVTGAGDTRFSARSILSLEGIPTSGFQLGNNPVYFDVSTTATWTDNADVCLDYNERGLGVDESLLTVLHYEGGSFQDKTLSLDTDLDNICGRVTSFSPFLMALRAPSVIGSVEPASSPSLSPVNITVKGSGFLTGSKLKLLSTTPDQTNPRGKVIRQGTTTEIILENVQYVDANTITATVPAFISPGSYQMVLQNRYGSGSELTDAYMVTAPTLEQLKTLLAEAGLDPDKAKKLAKYLEDAEEAQAQGDTKKLVKALKEFKEELEKLLGGKKQGLFDRLIKTAFAKGTSKVSSDSAMFKEASGSDSGKPQEDGINSEKINELIKYTDGLITSIEKQNPSLLSRLLNTTDMDTEEVRRTLAIALAVAGGTVAMTYFAAKRGARGNKWCLHCHAFYCSLEKHPHPEKSEIK